MPPPFVIDKGNTLPALTATLRDGAGNPINLTGTTVTVTVRNPATNALKVNAAAVSITDAPNGRVQYTWQAADTNTAAIYLYYFTITYPGGATVNVPNESQNVLEVVDPAQTISASLGYCSTDDLRNFGVTTTNADDLEMGELCLVASRVIDDYCGVEQGFFGAATARTVSFFDVRNPVVPLPIPFTGVTAVVVDNRPLDVSTYTVTNYGVFLGILGMFDADGFPRKTFTQLTHYIARYGAPYGSHVDVTATFGYSTIPKPIHRASVRIGARMAKESLDDIVDPSITSITTEGYSRTWNPRSWWMHGVPNQGNQSLLTTGDSVADRLLAPYIRQVVG